MTSTADFSVYVGAETGILKGFNFEKQKSIAKNLNSLAVLKREHEITALAWGNQQQTEVLVGLRDQRVRVYDTDFKGFSTSMEANIGEGPIRGIGKTNGVLVTAVENGMVKLWKFRSGEKTEMNTLTTGETLVRMRISPHDENIMATGGKENDLQLWDLNCFGSCIFKAKNVRNDFLDLRVPVWVSDMAFLPQTSHVAISSRHGHVRLYDWKAGPRRPVIDSKPQEGESWTCIAATQRENQLLIGSGRGRVLLFDLRQKSVVHAYRGFTGGIRDVACSPSQPLFVSVGLDRFVRVHHLDRQTPVAKIYAKSRLNNVLVGNDFRMELDAEDPVSLSKGEIPKEIRLKASRKRKAQNND